MEEKIDKSDEPRTFARGEDLMTKRPETPLTWRRHGKSEMPEESQVNKTIDLAKKNGWTIEEAKERGQSASSAQPKEQTEQDDYNQCVVNELAEEFSREFRINVRPDDLRMEERVREMRLVNGKVRTIVEDAPVCRTCDAEISNRDDVRHIEGCRLTNQMLHTRRLWTLVHFPGQLAGVFVAGGKTYCEVCDVEIKGPQHFVKNGYGLECPDVMGKYRRHQEDRSTDASARRLANTIFKQIVRASPNTRPNRYQTTGYKTVRAAECFKTQQVFKEQE